MFQKPFIEFILIYLIGIVIGLSIYIVIYYIVAFNVFFEKGIDIEVLRKNTFIKQLIFNIILIAIFLFGITLLKSQDVVLGNFLNLKNGTTLKGAGLADALIKVWGYRIFAVLILVCSIISVRLIEKGKFKKLAITLMIIPAYLVLLFAILLGFDLIYLNKSELDREQKYINYNMEYTKNAYGINVPEIEIENSGTITSQDIENNKNVIDNINLVKKENTIRNIKRI